MVFTHPRAGKSELTSRRGPAFILGMFPDAQIIAMSYSADLAQRMNRDVQRIIDAPAYKEIFPNTLLYGKNIRATSQGNYLRNSDIFEVVGHKGVYVGAGREGGITGMGFDRGIIDDPIKNRAEAESKTFRDNLWNTYISTFYTRQEKQAHKLLTITRWHSDDLAGRLIKAMEDDPEAEKWIILNLPAIAEVPIAPYDPRKIGEALWPNKYDEAKLKQIEITVGPYEWESMWQQRPPDSKFSLFNLELIKIVNPETVDLSKCKFYGALDPSEGGHDYAGLTTIAVLPDNRWLIWDCNLEVDAQGDSIDKIVANHVQYNYTLFRIEANSLGIAKDAHARGKLSTFEMQLRKVQKDLNTIVPYDLFWNTRNKEDRIRALQPHYNNGQLCFRSDWAKKYKKLLMMFKGFPNADFDDGPDSVEICVSAILGGIQYPSEWLPNDDEDPPHGSPIYSGPY